MWRKGSLLQRPIPTSVKMEGKNKGAHGRAVLAQKDYQTGAACPPKCGALVLKSVTSHFLPRGIRWRITAPCVPVDWRRQNKGWQKKGMAGSLRREHEAKHAAVATAHGWSAKTPRVTQLAVKKKQQKIKSSCKSLRVFVHLPWMRPRAGPIVFFIRQQVERDLFF